MRTETEINEIMGKLREGHNVDLSLYNGILRSSKEAMMCYTDQNATEGYISVYHGISDCFEDFSEKAFIAVLKGERDIWDGDLTEPAEEDEHEPCGEDCCAEMLAELAGTSV